MACSNGLKRTFKSDIFGISIVSFCLCMSMPLVAWFGKTTPVPRAAVSSQTIPAVSAATVPLAADGACVTSTTKTIQPWRPVQEHVRDTVVQIFSQIAEFDWLQPYRTPMQGAARGSGFLISDQGDIITNAHVVDQAVAVWIQIPSLGKQLIDKTVVRQNFIFDAWGL